MLTTDISCNATDVVVVSYNNEQDIVRCIASVLADGANPLVVDNVSSDNTLLILATKFPQVRVPSNSPKGYAKAANAVLLIRPANASS